MRKYRGTFVLLYFPSEFFFQVTLTVYGAVVYNFFIASRGRWCGGILPVFPKEASCHIDRLLVISHSCTLRPLLSSRK